MRQKLFGFLIVLFLVVNLSAKDSISASKPRQINKCDTVYDNTTNSKTLRHSGEITIRSNNRSIFEFIFPSIIALIVGLMAYIATIISAEKQRNIIEKQIITNKEAIKEQINASLKIAELDFRKSVLSNNRQAWINELRNFVSDLVSHFDSISLNTNALRHDDYKRILFLITKIELMLNPVNDSEFINSVGNLKLTLLDLHLNKIPYSEAMEKLEALKEMTKTTLKTEWERVKKGE